MGKTNRFINHLLWVGLLLAGLTHLKSHFIDYPIFELAGQKVMSGRGLELYDLNRTGSGGFYYSFFFASCFAVFSALGFWGGRLLYLLLLFLCYRKILSFSLKSASTLVGSTRFDNKLLENLLILITLYSFNDALMTANIGIFLATLCILCFERRERPLLSGVFLAAAIVFKIYPALLLGYFIWERRWALLAVCFITCVLLWAGLPIAFFGFVDGLQILKNQLYVVSHFNSHWNLGGHVFQNIPATAIRYGKFLGFSEKLSYRVALGSGLTTLLLLFFPSFINPDTRVRKDLSLPMFIIALAAIPMLTPVSWYNMGLFYSPLLAVVLFRTLSGQDKTVRFLFGVYVVFYCLLTPDIVGRSLNQKLAFWGLPFLGIISVMSAFFRCEKIVMKNFNLVKSNPTKDA